MCAALGCQPDTAWSKAKVLPIYKATNNDSNDILKNCDLSNYQITSNYKITIQIFFKRAIEYRYI